MSEFKFIHAADLHLDVPMKHIKSSGMNNTADMTFKALNNLIDFAIKEKVDALLLAGDIWNHEDASLKARLALKKACETLQKAEIKVYIIHGNHDPLEDNFQYLTLPDNVFIFKDTIETVPFIKDEKEIAYIHGISHATRKETKNLAKSFPIITEKAKQEAFHIAMLHTTLAQNTGEAVYAPCTLAELIEKNPHYWALGHIHAYEILNTEPHIVYSGSLQGLHINETGAHGCVYVCLKRDENNNTQIKTDFISLAPLQWEKINFNFDNENFHEEDGENQKKIQQDLTDLESIFIEKLEKITAQATKNLEYIIARFILTGHTDLNKKLRNIYALQELIENLNEHGKSLSSSFNIKDIIIETEESMEGQNKGQSIEEILKEDNFLAQVLREGEFLLSEENLNSETLQVLIQKLYHESPLQKQHQKTLPLITDEELLRKMVQQAQYICIQNMEN